MVWISYSAIGRFSPVSTNQPLLAGDHKVMLSILADQYRSYMSPNDRGGEGGCGVSGNEDSCAHGAQINFGDLTPHLNYAYLIEEKPAKDGHVIGGFQNNFSGSHAAFEQRLEPKAAF